MSTNFLVVFQHLSENFIPPLSRAPARLSSKKQKSRDNRLIPPLIIEIFMYFAFYRLAKVPSFGACIPQSRAFFSDGRRQGVCLRKQTIGC